jgi:hypothetical protein
MPFKYNITFFGPTTEETMEKIFVHSLFLGRLALQEEAGLLDIPELDAIEVEMVVGLKDAAQAPPTS